VGKQISISLLLKGSFLKEALPKINEAIHKGRLQGFYIETEGSPWQNDLSETYKNPLKPIASEVDFLKISNKISISELNHLGSFYNSSFDKLLQLVKF